LKILKTITNVLIKKSISSKATNYKRWNNRGNNKSGRRI